MKFLPKKLRDTDALNKISDDFKEQFVAADKISDPADRIEAMLTLQGSVSKHVVNAFGAMSGRSTNIEAATVIPTLIGSLLGGIVLSVAGMPLIGVPLLLVGGGSVYSLVTGRVSNKLFNSMQKEIGPHFNALSDVLEKTNADVDGLLKNRSNEIAASEKFGSIYDRFPEVRDSFIKTFNQAVARKELSTPPAPPKPGSAPGLTL